MSARRTAPCSDCTTGNRNFKNHPDCYQAAHEQQHAPPRGRRATWERYQEHVQRVEAFDWHGDEQRLSNYACVDCQRNRTTKSGRTCWLCVAVRDVLKLNPATPPHRKQRLGRLRDATSPYVSAAADAKAAATGSRPVATVDEPTVTHSIGELATAADRSRRWRNYRDNAILRIAVQMRMSGASYREIAVACVDDGHPNGLHHSTVVEMLEPWIADIDHERELAANPDIAFASESSREAMHVAWTEYLTFVLPTAPDDIEDHWPGDIPDWFIREQYSGNTRLIAVDAGALDADRETNRAAANERYNREDERNKPKRNTRYQPANNPVGVSDGSLLGRQNNA